jgi:hypothetical protein
MQPWTGLDWKSSSSHHGALVKSMGNSSLQQELLVTAAASHSWRRQEDEAEYRTSRIWFQRRSLDLVSVEIRRRRRWNLEPVMFLIYLTGSVPLGDSSARDVGATKNKLRTTSGYLAVAIPCRLVIYPKSVFCWIEEPCMRRSTFLH